MLRIMIDEVNGSERVFEFPKMIENYLTKERK